MPKFWVGLFPPETLPSIGGPKNCADVTKESGGGIPPPCPPMDFPPCPPMLPSQTPKFLSFQSPKLVLCMATKQLTI